MKELHPSNALLAKIAKRKRVTRNPLLYQTNGRRSFNLSPVEAAISSSSNLRPDILKMFNHFDVFFVRHTRKTMNVSYTKLRHINVFVECSFANRFVVVGSRLIYLRTKWFSTLIPAACTSLPFTASVSQGIRTN